MGTYSLASDHVQPTIDKWATKSLRHFDELARLFPDMPLSVAAAIREGTSIALYDNGQLVVESAS